MRPSRHSRPTQTSTSGAICWCASCARSHAPTTWTPDATPEVRRLSPIHAATLRERLTRHASWVKRKQGEDGEHPMAPAHPPDWSVQAVAEPRVVAGVCGRWRGSPRYPSSGPTAPSWRRPGYDRRSGILYTPEIRVSEGPRIADPGGRAGGRAETCTTWWSTSRSRRPNHKAAWLSTLLTAFARPTLPGPAPALPLRRQRVGGRQDLLADIISIVGIGRQRGPDHPPLQRGGDGQVHSGAWRCTGPRWSSSTTRRRGPPSADPPSTRR